jgi:uncharacterized membrane protein (DUF106 family)
VRDFAAQLVAWLNVPANWLGDTVLAFIAVLPGWLSNTIISAVTGVILLVIFKYTSNQRAIGKARDDIKANMLALKLFKDSISVTLAAEGHIFRSAFLLLLHSIRPMLVMIVPVCLLLSQLGLWYQYRAFLPQEEATVTMRANIKPGESFPNVDIEPNDAIEVVSGPVRVPVKREIVWQIKSLKEGEHRLIFSADGQRFGKGLVVGGGFSRVSVARPGWDWAQILMNPAENAFAPNSPVRSITIDYPTRHSWTSGADWWLVYFFVASMVFAFIFKPLFKVRI